MIQKLYRSQRLITLNNAIKFPAQTWEHEGNGILDWQSAKSAKYKPKHPA